jgi:N-acetylneuraminate lyase
MVDGGNEMSRFQLIAAAFTPMHEGGQLHLDLVPELVDFVLHQGEPHSMEQSPIDGLFIGGSTGEFSSLTIEERKGLTLAYQQAAAGRTKLFAHVGSNSIEESKDLAAHAEALELDAIGYAPPSYFRPGNVQAVAACLQQVAAAAPNTPLYYYHIPPLTGVHIRMVDLLPLVEHSIASFAGVKFSCTQFDDLVRCVHSRFEMLFGADEMLLSGMAMGAAGAVGSTYNFLARQYRKVIDAYAEGDMKRAQRCQSEVSKVVHDILALGGMNAIKASMTCSGVDIGPPRLPLQPITSAQMSKLREVLHVEATA